MLFKLLANSAVNPAGMCCTTKIGCLTSGLISLNTSRKALGPPVEIPIAIISIFPLSRKGVITAFSFTGLLGKTTLFKTSLLFSILPDVLCKPSKALEYIDGVRLAITAVFFART